MIKKILFCLMLFTFFNSWIFAQNFEKWGISAQYQFVNPIGSLSNWFKPSPSSISLSIGKFTSEQWFWEIKAEMIQYSKENADKLYYDDLDLKLEIYGIAAQAKYFLFQNQSKLQPYATGSAGVYRWLGQRGSYLLEDKFVPKRDQSDWSWGFNFGIGLNFYLFKKLALTTTGSYQIIVGELWPALAVRLENVSGFQCLKASAGVSFYF